MNGMDPTLKWHCSPYLWTQRCRRYRSVESSSKEQSRIQATRSPPRATLRKEETKLGVMLAVKPCWREKKKKTSLTVIMRDCTSEVGGAMNARPLSSETQRQADGQQQESDVQTHCVAEKVILVKFFFFTFRWGFLINLIAVSFFKMDRLSFTNVLFHSRVRYPLRWQRSP